MSTSAPIVFVSSTCYDLTDLRAELGAWLRRDGFVVKLSDDLDSGFKVDGSVDKIETCLQNIRKSDIVLFIFDRFYGGPLEGKYKEKSATHVEFDEAVRQEKKMLHFARRGTWQDFGRWRREKDEVNPDWVDAGQHQKLFEFLDEIDDLHNKEGRNDWLDVFEKSPDLRAVALKRVYDIFPEMAGGRALTRDRVVRLHLEQEPAATTGGKPIPVRFRVENAGLNIAQEVRAYATLEGREVDGDNYRGVLAPGANTDQWEVGLQHDGKDKDYQLVCHYQNLWGDEYEVSAPLTQRAPGKQYTVGQETFRVVEAAD